MAMRDAFPFLDSEGYTETSPAALEYNCIAWAAGRTDVAWWPDSQGIGYWPEAAPRTETLEAFYLAFESIGYSRCADGGVEAGIEKIALYALGGRPKHAARQLPDGQWTSKLGKHIDIAHTLRGVEGPVYGQVHGYMQRPRSGV
jgi:hypothetical protein